MRYVALLTVALVSLAFAPAPFPRSVRGDLKRLQGTWVAEPDKKYSDDYLKTWGEPAPTETVEIYGNRVRTFRNGKREDLEWRVTVNENTTPRTFTLALVPTPPEWSFFKCPVQGTYVLEGDRLSIGIEGAEGMAVLKRKKR